MQIFVLDQDPKLAAIALCDKHIVKMVSEAAQILCTVSYFRGGISPYKPTHIHHPCVKWVRQSRQNFNWLLKHGLAIGEEYTFRYKKKHKSHIVLEILNKYSLKGSNNGLSPFIQLFPEKYHNQDPIQGYRNFYINEKRYFKVWNKERKPPEWWR